TPLSRSTPRGIHTRAVSMVTSKMLGGFRDNARTRAEFLRVLDKTGRSRRAEDPTQCRFVGAASAAGFRPARVGPEAARFARALIRRCAPPSPAAQEKG